MKDSKTLSQQVFNAISSIATVRGVEIHNLKERFFSITVHVTVWQDGFPVDMQDDERGFTVQICFEKSSAWFHGNMHVSTGTDSVDINSIKESCDRIGMAAMCAVMIANQG
jgi:hypothetical protein